MKYFFTAIATISLLFSLNAQKSELGLTLEKGKEYMQASDSKVTMKQEFAGQNIDMIMRVKGTMSFLVEEVIPAGYDMEVTFKRLGISMESIYMSTEFDSENKDEDDVYSNILAKMVDRPFKMTMSKSGKIINVQGMEEMWNDVINSFPEISAMEREQIKTQMENAYGGDALRGNMEMVTAIFPNEAVAIGDEWTVNTSLGGGMPSTVSTVYKLVERNNDHILITGNGQIKSLEDAEYVETNGMPMKYDMNGTMKSEIKLNGKSGWVLESKTSQELDGDVHIDDNPQLPGGMNMKMSMKNETEITGSK